MRIINIALAFGMVVLSFYLFSVGKSFFIPLVIAIILWYFTIMIADSYKKFTVGRFRMPHWLAITFSLFTIGIVVFFLIRLINSNIYAIVRQAPEYQEKFQEIILRGYNSLGIQDPPELNEIFESVNLGTIFSAIGKMVTTIAGYTGMIIVYVLLLLLEYRTFDMKIRTLFPDKKRYIEVNKKIEKVSNDIMTYVKIKSIAGIIMAVLCYIVLIVIGVDFAAFWALLVFFLNYIPTIGAIVSVIFPLILTLIQFDTIGPFILVGVTLTVVHFVIGSILEPRYMGETLNLSPVVIVISLAVWENVWGVIGMFLGVPIMVIVNMILADFPSTRPIAIMLSEKGKVKDL